MITQTIPTIEIDELAWGRINNTLSDFDNIDPRLEVLKPTYYGCDSRGNCTCDFGVVTYGGYSIIIAAEGYDYARYKTAPIKNDLLEKLTDEMLVRGGFIYRKETELKPFNTWDEMLAHVKYHDRRLNW